MNGDQEAKLLLEEMEYWDKVEEDDDWIPRSYKHATVKEAGAQSELQRPRGLRVPSGVLEVLRGEVRTVEFEPE